ncbi:hypothetical protein [Bacteroides sp. 51]|uniref:hypothetical protein n=1 Tax=Bacteroides sp. 51 TaxID=2302938 RepID=UPI0013D307B0|nr:hypothetical protein [Bacteroides sp. 51]NDV80582.1 hypothetical protein [Bacteroides sp. 51]
MRDQINRNNEFAEENLRPTGHPAKEKFSRWESSISDNLDVHEEQKHKDTSAQRKKKIKEMDEIIKEDIERTKE